MALRARSIPSELASTFRATCTNNFASGASRARFYQVRGIAPAAGYASTVEDLGRFASWQFRLLDNVYICPHVSGSGFYGYHKIGEQTVEALRAYFAGRPVCGAVDYDRYEVLA